MSNDEDSEQFPTYSDITYWIFECNRFLFLAKVHKNDPSVDLKSGDPIVFVNKLLTSKKMSQNGSNIQYTLKFQKNPKDDDLFPKVIELPINIPENDVAELTLTLKNIKSKNWKELEDDNKIINSQKILLNYLNQLDDAVNKEINNLPKCS